MVIRTKSVKAAVRELVGVDVFLAWDAPVRDPVVLGRMVEDATAANPLALRGITNRGVKVYPGGLPETVCTDHWRCRFTPRDGRTTTPGELIALLGDLSATGLDFVKTENLYTFDGVSGFAALPTE